MKPFCFSILFLLTAIALGAAQPDSVMVDKVTKVLLRPTAEEFASANPTVGADGKTYVGGSAPSDGVGRNNDVYQRTNGEIYVKAAGTWGSPVLTLALGTHSHATSDVTGLDAALAAKAPLASPTFTGTPAAPTADPGTTSTQLATTEFTTLAAAAAKSEAVVEAAVDATAKANAALAAAVASSAQLAGDNALTGLNSTARAFRVVPVNLSTVTSGSTITPLVQTLYHGTISGSVTVVGPIMTAGQSYLMKDVVVSSAGTMSFSGFSPKRLGQANSTITSLALTNGIHSFLFSYDGTSYTLADTIPGSITTAQISDLDTDGTLAANSDARVATQKATKTYVDARLSDTAWSSNAWDGVTAVAPSKNALYDYLHLADTDDDGLPNKVDISSQGLVRSDGTGVLSSITEAFVIACSDETTALSTGTAVRTFRMPYGATITAVRASVNTVSSSGLPTVDINEEGTTILSTKLTIDASEKSSSTAATPAVISDSSIADNAEMTIDIDTAGTGAKGLKVTIFFTR